MKLKVFILFLIYSLFISETTNSYSSTIIQKDKKISLTKKSKKNKNKIQKSKCSINIQTIYPFKVEELLNFFPDSVLNSEVSPPSTGRRNGKLNQITSGSVEYQLSKRTILTITLTDYGSYDNISSNELRDYITIPNEFGKSTVEFTLPCGEGYNLWHEKTNSGTISFLYCYRFVLQFEIMNWEKSLPKFEEFVKYFDLNKLVDESKKKIELEKK